ncbi:biotin carboxylase N-terminal domain-containing protein, partial [Nocardia farcinica]|uniref:biotin carboxylase N-terminal domain-containing protein n=1 Tax=Nocardia farcinica TaxID=37329 RepID=UPI002457B47C
MRVVVVNRGEIAVRIVRAARAHGYRTLVVHTPAEAATLPVRLADDAVELPGEGAAAYLDIPAVVAAAPPPPGGARGGPGPARGAPPGAQALRVSAGRPGADAAACASKVSTP